MRIIYLITILFFCFHIQSSASHIIGSTTQHKIEPKNDGTFDISGKIILYSDRKEEGSLLNFSIDIGIYKMDDGGWDLAGRIFLELDTVITYQDKIDNANCFNVSRTIEQGEYSFKYNLPKIKGDYMFVFQRCCRTNVLSNISDPDEQGSAVSLIITESGQKVNSSSPNLVGNLFEVLKAGKLNQINFEHKDENALDTKKYTLFAPYVAGGSITNSAGCSSVLPNPSKCYPPFEQIQYISGFNEQLPFGLNTSVSLDEKNGIVEVTPSLQGIYLVSLKIEEFRYGNLLSTKFIDFQMTVIADLVPIYKSFGERYYDKNSNGIKESDEPQVNIPIKLNKQYCSLSTSELGKWKAKLFADTTYEISSADTLWVINTPNGTIMPGVTSSGDSIRLDIPMIPVNNNTDRIDNDIFLTNPRCNEEAKLNIRIINSGSHNITQSLFLRLDTLVEFISATGNPLITDSLIIWENISLDIFENNEFLVMVQMPNETFTDQELNFILQSEYVENKTILDLINYNTVVRCSIDPNDKLASPNRGPLNLTGHDENIYYTIRFQNYGNDYARDVFLIDNISPNLDVKTFSVLEASHHFTYNLTASGTLKVDFKDIMLPDTSTNETESEGFFIFKIKPKPNLEEGTQIFNYANIIFDKNRPIVTDTVLNTISYFITKDTIFRKEASNPNEIETLALVPNPVQGTSFQLKNSKTSNINPISLKVYSVSGQLVKEIETFYNTNINISELSDMVYFIKVSEKNILLGTYKLLKLK